jgi:hypothetical protein
LNSVGSSGRRGVDGGNAVEVVVARSRL